MTLDLSREEAKAEFLGSEAYRQGKSIRDNPYNKEARKNLYEIWEKSYTLEKSFWEDDGERESEAT